MNATDVDGYYDDGDGDNNDGGTTSGDSGILSTNTNGIPPQNIFVHISCITPKRIQPY